MAIDKGEAVNTAVTPSIETPAVGKPGIFHRLKTFLRDVRAELHKTDWPSRNALTKYVVVVMVTIVVVAIYLYVSDQIVAWLMQKLGMAPKV